ncbi:hypothetical protein E2P81_ATG05619 [Venturia nashicola]|nr:hypothetical protein E2P81_ATG05619 [Venturia nashicola]
MWPLQTSSHRSGVSGVARVRKNKDKETAQNSTGRGFNSVQGLAHRSSNNISLPTCHNFINTDLSSALMYQNSVNHNTLIKPPPTPRYLMPSMIKCTLQCNSFNSSELNS